MIWTGVRPYRRYLSFRLRGGVARIATVAFTSADKVGAVLHNFTDDGFDSSKPPRIPPRSAKRSLTPSRANGGSAMSETWAGHLRQWQEPPTSTWMACSRLASRAGGHLSTKAAGESLGRLTGLGASIARIEQETPT